MQNSREINEEDRRHFKNHRRYSSAYWSWKESVFIQSLSSKNLTTFKCIQIDFHMLKHPYCNLNPTDQNKNQNALSIKNYKTERKLLMNPSW